jgi:hypothetical protein
MAWPLYSEKEVSKSTAFLEVFTKTTEQDTLLLCVKATGSRKTIREKLPFFTFNISCRKAQKQRVEYMVLWTLFCS